MTLEDLGVGLPARFIVAARQAAVPGDDVLGRAALQRRAGIAGDEREEPLHQPDAGVVDRAPQGRGQTRSAGLRGPWKPGIAEFERDAVHPQPEHLGRQLGHDGVGARPDVGCAAADACGAVAADRRARLASGLVVGEGHPGHAVADQPAPIAHRAHGRFAPRPAEPVGAHLVALAQGLARPREPGRGMDLGVVAQPQLDRVHAQLVRQLVEQRLEREVAFRLAGRPHHRDRRDVEPDPLVAGGDVRARIRRGRADSKREVGVAGRWRQRLQRRLASRRLGSHRGGRDALVVDRDQLALACGGDLEVLHGAGPSPDPGEHLRPGEAKPDRPFDGASGQRGEDRVRPAPQPGTETAADVGR